MKRAPRGQAPATLADELGGALARLHAFPLDEARHLGVPDRELWGDHYPPMIERCVGLLPEASAQWLERRAKTFIEEGGTSLAARESAPR